MRTAVLATPKIKNDLRGVEGVGMNSLVLVSEVVVFPSLLGMLMY